MTAPFWGGFFCGRSSLKPPIDVVTHTIMEKLKSIELFAGAGGLGIGTAKAGFKPVKVVEYNKHCRQTLTANRTRANGPLHDWPSNIGCDVRDQNYSSFEGKIALVSGGPPCQPFSLGGRHNAQADRRDMFPEAVRAVREARPKAFLFENVKGLTRESFSTYFEYVRLQMNHPQLVAKSGEDWSDHLRRLQRHHTSGSQTSDDYRVVTQVMNAADYGVPQQRHRIFFVGLRADMGAEYSFPTPTHSRVSLITDIASGRYAKRMGLSAETIAVPPQIKRALYSHLTKDRPLDADRLPAWKTVREALSDLPPPRLDGTDEWLNHHRRTGAKAYPGHTGSHLDFASKALKAGVHGVPGGENMLRHANGRVRYFTVRESARLQTFPDDYEVTGSWSESMRQLGNAVPVELAFTVAKGVHEAIRAS